VYKERKLILMDYKSLTELQKDMMLKAYKFYRKTPKFFERIELSANGVALDLYYMPELAAHFNDLVNKGVIYNDFIGKVVYYWLNDVGVKLMEENYIPYTHRSAEIQPIWDRKDDK
jgi:hypothetical protein